MSDEELGCGWKYKTRTVKYCLFFWKYVRGNYAADMKERERECVCLNYLQKYRSFSETIKLSFSNGTIIKKF